MFKNLALLKVNKKQKKNSDKSLKGEKIAKVFFVFGKRKKKFLFLVKEKKNFFAEAFRSF